MNYHGIITDEIKRIKATGKRVNLTDTIKYFKGKYDLRISKLALTKRRNNLQTDCE